RWLRASALWSTSRAPQRVRAPSDQLAPRVRQTPTIRVGENTKATRSASHVLLPFPSPSFPPLLVGDRTPFQFETHTLVIVRARESKRARLDHSHRRAGGLRPSLHRTHAELRFCMPSMS